MYMYVPILNLNYNKSSPALSCRVCHSVYVCMYIVSSQVDGPELPSLKHLESAGKHLGALLRIHHPPSKGDEDCSA